MSQNIVFSTFGAGMRTPSAAPSFVYASERSVATLSYDAVARPISTSVVSGAATCLPFASRTRTRAKIRSSSVTRHCASQA
ncbi:MAG: hypothetical protein HMLKMBBP_00527 [Planctomycetes bacterium]|nr:hypothetical protein [Planctomycetota bacterium]